MSKQTKKTQKPSSLTTKDEIKAREIYTWRVFDEDQKSKRALRSFFGGLR